MQQAAEKPMFNPGDVTKVNGLRYVVLGQNEEGHFVAVPETAIITMHVDGGAVFVTEIIQDEQPDEVLAALERVVEYHVPRVNPLSDAAVLSALAVIAKAKGE